MASDEVHIAIVSSTARPNFDAKTNEATLFVYCLTIKTAFKIHTCAVLTTTIIIIIIIITIFCFLGIVPDDKSRNDLLSGAEQPAATLARSLGFCKRLLGLHSLRVELFVDESLSDLSSVRNFELRGNTVKKKLKKNKKKKVVRLGFSNRLQLTNNSATQMLTFFSMARPRSSSTTAKMGFLPDE